MKQPTWKSLIRWSTAVALFLSVPAVAASQFITGTKHDLSANATTLGIVNYGQVCIYCHTPHKGLTTAPLWNRAFSATTFTTSTMYTSVNSATMDMTVGAAPGPVSKACLSCHDGTIGLDAITNKPPGTWTPLLAMIPAGSNLGTILTDDHPIAVTYSTTADPAFNAIASGKVGVLPLYGPGKNELECGTCHNVHNNTNAPFLRMSNSGSSLCLTCHIK